MIEYAAYALAAAGAYLFLMAANITVSTAFARIWAKLLPAIFGAGCLWLSAIVLVQA